MPEYNNKQTPPVAHLNHLLCLGATVGDVLRLLQQHIDLLLLVQLGNQLALKVVLDEVHQEVHDRLWYRVLDVLTHDHEVRLDQSLW